MRYIGRDVPRPEPAFHTLANSPQAATLVSAHSSTSEDEQLNSAFPSALLSSSVTTQSPTPVTGYGLSSRCESLGNMGTSSSGSIGAKSSHFNEPFSSPYRASRNGMEQAGSDSRRPHSSVFGGQRNSLYSRSVSSRALLGPQRRDTMQCLRCGARYPVTNLDNYEKHIRDCYSEVQ